MDWPHHQLSRLWFRNILSFVCINKVISTTTNQFGNLIGSFLTVLTQRSFLLLSHTLDLRICLCFSTFSTVKATQLWLRLNQAITSMICIACLLIMLSLYFRWTHPQNNLFSLGLLIFCSSLRYPLIFSLEIQLFKGNPSLMTIFLNRLKSDRFMSKFNSCLMVWLRREVHYFKRKYSHFSHTLCYSVPFELIYWILIQKSSCCRS